MTLEVLLQLKFSASELERLSDAELEKLLGPKFQVTRPDLSKWKEDNKHVKVSMARPTARIKSNEELEKEAKVREAKELVFRKLGIRV